MASPRPDAPPVTIADVPFRSIAVFLLPSRGPLGGPGSSGARQRIGGDAGAGHICSGACIPSSERPSSSTPRGEVAEPEARLPHRLVPDQDAASLVEPGERGGQLEEVRAQLRWAVGVRRGRDGLGEAQAAGGPARARRARRAGAPTPGGGGCRPGPAEDGADAGVGVLEVGPGVALEGQHAVPVEDVVAHRRSVDRSAYLTAPMPRARATASCCSGDRSLLRSFMAAAARSIPSVSRSIRRSELPLRLAIFLPSVPRMKPNDTWTAADAVGQVAGELGHGEDEPEVQRLLGGHHVDEPSCAPRRPTRSRTAARSVAG